MPVRTQTCAYSTTRPSIATSRLGGHALLGGLDQLHKGFDLEARPAYEGPVHVCLCHDVAHVLGLYGAAVEDADTLGEAVAVRLPQQVPDPADRVLRVLWGSRLPGTDGPDWLVGEDE